MPIKPAVPRNAFIEQIPHLEGSINPIGPTNFMTLFEHFKENGYTDRVDLMCKLPRKNKESSKVSIATHFESAMNDHDLKYILQSLAGLTGMGRLSATKTRALALLFKYYPDSPITAH